MGWKRISHCLQSWDHSGCWMVSGGYFTPRIINVGRVLTLVVMEAGLMSTHTAITIQIAHLLYYVFFQFLPLSNRAYLHTIKCFTRAFALAPNTRALMSGSHRRVSMAQTLTANLATSRGADLRSAEANISEVIFPGGGCFRVHSQHYMCEWS